MDSSSFITKMHNVLIKISIVCFMVLAVIYGVVYLFQLDLICWGLASSCLLTIISGLLLNKYRLDKANRKILPLIVRILFFIASAILIFVSAKQLSKYSFSYSPNKTHRLLIETKMYGQEEFVYLYKTKYYIFKVEGAHYVFSEFAPLDKNSIIIWPNEDSAYVEGTYLQIGYSDKDYTVVYIDPSKKYYIHFN